MPLQEGALLGVSVRLKNIVKHRILGLVKGRAVPKKQVDRF